MMTTGILGIAMLLVVLAALIAMALVDGSKEDRTSDD